MLVQAEKEDEREIVKTILRNHGLDVIVTSSVCQKLFGSLEIKTKRKKYD